MNYDIKDSGARQEFEGGAVRDTEDGKLDYSNLFVWFEPMGTRYAAHMTKGRAKYPDPEPGVPNWTLFEATPENLARTERSLDRHYKAYRMGKTDEDHAAAIIFNLNLAEKIRTALTHDPIEIRDEDGEVLGYECDEECACNNGGPALNAMLIKNMASVETREELDSFLARPVTTDEDFSGVVF